MSQSRDSAKLDSLDRARMAMLALEKLAVRPGKPTWFGMTPAGPVLGLPDNPASALVCAYLFLRPLLATMLGRT